MNSSIKTFSIFSLSLLWVVLALGVTATASSREDQIGELMKLSGIERQLAQLPSLMNMRMGQQKRNVPPEVQEGMNKALLEAYHPGVLLAILRGVAARIYNPEKMSATLAWLKGDVGKHMTSLEIASSTVEGQKAKNDYAKSWETHPPDQDRIQLMLRFNKATQATELSIQILVASFDGMMKGMMALMPVEKRIGDEKMAEIKNKMVQQMAEPLLNQAIVGFMFTYRDVSTEDMGKAIAFYESDAGVWYQDVMVDGLLKGMEESGIRFGQQVESITKNAPKRS